MIYLLNYFNNEFKFFHEVCIIKKPNPQNIYIPPILKPTYKCARAIGWVNLCQKFEIVEYTVCGKLNLPHKKMERHLLKLAQLACKFARICEYLKASCIQHF